MMKEVKRKLNKNWEVTVTHTGKKGRKRIENV
jgi:hypothetical protein